MEKFILTSIVCFLPIILGLTLWEKLPDSMAIHFDINNDPDGFAPRDYELGTRGITVSDGYTL